MNKLISNCLFLKDPKRFEKLKAQALVFRDKYIGDSIVRDSIFDIINNYASVNGQDIKILKFPIDDENVWAFTCVRNGILFVTINTALALNEQIFAAAHELYHIYRYIEDSQNDYIEQGSILTKNDFEEKHVSEEDREANAFAALILAPKKQIEDQARLVGHSFTDSDLMDMIHFMDYFAMPYKAMVLKLLECERYTKDQADLLLNKENKEVIEEVFINDCGTRWVTKTYENNLRSMEALVKSNLDSFNITEARYEEDKAYLDGLMDSFKK